MVMILKYISLFFISFFILTNTFPEERSHIIYVGWRNPEIDTDLDDARDIQLNREHKFLYNLSRRVVSLRNKQFKRKDKISIELFAEKASDVKFDVLTTQLSDKISKLEKKKRKIIFIVFDKGSEILKGALTKFINQLYLSNDRMTICARLKKLIVPWRLFVWDEFFEKIQLDWIGHKDVYVKALATLLNSNKPSKTKAYLKIDFQSIERDLFLMSLGREIALQNRE